MLSTILLIYTTLAGLVLSAATTVTSASRPSLVLRVSGPEAVDGIDNLILITTITNTGNETLKLLNSPSCPLSKAPTDIIDIKDSTGRKPLFTGVEIAYDPHEAAIFGSEDAFTILPPGQSVDIEHDLSEAYNFALLSPGSYSFEARNLFHYVDPSTSGVASIYADAVAHQASISGKLTVTRSDSERSTGSQKRDYRGCSEYQQTILQAMSQSAAEHIDKTLSYLESTIGLTYTAWFGRFNPERFSNVSNVFRNLHGVNLPMLTYDCSCKMQAQFAWVTPTEFGVIKICPVFWTATTDMQKIVLIMMASEWTDVGDTHEYAWTALDCQILAQENPEKAVGNAATYGFFALLA